MPRTTHAIQKAAKTIDRPMVSPEIERTLVVARRLVSCSCGFPSHLATCAIIRAERNIRYPHRVEFGPESRVAVWKVTFNPYGTSAGARKAFWRIVAGVGSHGVIRLYVDGVLKASRKERLAAKPRSKR